MEPATGAQVEPEGLPCPECGETIPPKGKMSPAMALGLHRKQAHGVAGRPRNAKRNKATAPQPEAVTPPTPLALVHSAAADARRGKSAPDAEGLANGMGRVYGYVGYFVSALIVDGDPNLRSEAEREQIASLLAPTPQEAKATMHPLARVLAGTQLNRTYGASVLENLDVADCLAAVGEQVRRWRSYMATRRPAPGGAFVPGVVGPPPTAPGPPLINADAPDGLPPNPMMGGYNGPQSPTWGRVIGADEVAAMRGHPGHPVEPQPEPTPEEA